MAAKRRRRRGRTITVTVRIPPSVHGAGRTLGKWSGKKRKARRSRRRRA